MKRVDPMGEFQKWWDDDDNHYLRLLSGETGEYLRQHRLGADFFEASRLLWQAAWKAGQWEAIETILMLENEVRRLEETLEAAAYPTHLWETREDGRGGG